jgi:hypothetical protein
MNKSEQINELAQALADVQREVRPAQFDSVNPYYKSKYASLGSVIEAAKILADHGLSYSQLPVSDGWYAGVENVLMHESGQWISERFMMPLDTDSKNPIQEAGKAITYARRYGLASMLGIYSDEDTDGNSNDQYKPTHTPSKTLTDRPSAPKKETVRPYKPEELKKRLAEVAQSQPPASDDQMSLLASMLGKVLENKDIRHDAQEFLFGARSLTEVDRKLINAGLKWLNIDENYSPDETAVKELESVQSAFLMSKGQAKMNKILDDLQV